MMAKYRGDSMAWLTTVRAGNWTASRSVESVWPPDPGPTRRKFVEGFAEPALLDIAITDLAQQAREPLQFAF
jgi:hypothetical protein